MRSDMHNHQLFSITTRHYQSKLRVYSSYFCSLVLTQLLTSALMLGGSHSYGAGNPFNSITINIYTGRFVMQFAIIWALLVSFAVSSAAKKNASFTLPGNRLSDSLSDFGFLLTCCVFGAITTTLNTVAFRIVILILHPGEVLAAGFYPSFLTLGSIACVSFLYLLLVSAGGYIAGTLYRMNRAFVVINIAAGVFLLMSVVNRTESIPLMAAIGSVLLYQNSLAQFALSAILISGLLWAVSITISQHTEVK